MLLAVGIGDLLWTTLAASGGGGPVTTRLSRLLWGAARGPEPGRRRHRTLRVAGMIVVSAMIIMWFLLIWLGWGLVFAGAERAVVSADTGAPATWLERFYFAGSTFTTLGIGDLLPVGAGWRIATAVASLSGLLVAMLGITFFFPVIEAVTHRRKVALQISSLGRDPYEIARHVATDAGRQELAEQLRALSIELHAVTQQHLSYPAVHYFHDISEDMSAPIRIAALDDALTLVACGVRPDERVAGPSVGAARFAIEALLGTLASSYVGEADEPPPAPSLEPLREAGIGTVGDDEFATAVADLGDHRRLMRAFVEDDGWSWDEVLGERAPEQAEYRSDALAG